MKPKAGHHAPKWTPKQRTSIWYDMHQNWAQHCSNRTWCIKLVPQRTKNRAQNDALHTKSNPKTAHRTKFEPKTVHSAPKIDTPRTKTDPETAQSAPNSSLKRHTAHQKRAQNGAPRTKIEPKTAHSAPISNPKRRTVHQNRAQNSAQRVQQRA